MQTTSGPFGRHFARLLQNTKFRFICMGLINTAVDFSILNAAMIITGAPEVVANIISTSVAICVSYLLNKRMVFKVEGKVGARQFALFLGVTLFGLWVVQGLAIHYTVAALHSSSLPTWAINNGAKVIATVLSTIWNYVWYSRLVFVDRTQAKNKK